MALGGLGLLALIPITAWELAGASSLPAPPLLLSSIAALQPLVLLVVAAFAGAFAAPKLGLRSLIAERASGHRPQVSGFGRIGGLALASALFGVVITLADDLSRPLWLPGGAAFPPYAQSWSPATLVFGALYGGITEEVMFRWGLMSVFALLLWRSTAANAPPPAWIFALAALLAAIVFAAAHLPAVAALVPLSPGPVIRTLAFNGLAGLWLGWVFRRRHLEAAMLCHAGLHVGFALYALSVLALA